MPNYKISGTSNEDSRIKVMYENQYLGYKDITTGAYQVVFPDQNPSADPDDDFTGTNGDPPDDTKWTVLGGDCTINNNRLRTLVGSSVHNSNVQAIAEISGDFDIRVTIAGGTGLPYGSGGGEIHFAIYNKNDFSDYLRAFIDCNTGGSYHGRVYVNSSQVYANNTPHSGDYSVRFRIRRYGTQVYVQYDKNLGSSWSTLVNDYNWGITDNVKIRLWSQNYGAYPTFSGDWDDFVVVEGVNEISTGGDVIVDVVGKSDSTGQVLGYGDITSIETEDAADIT